MPRGKISFLLNFRLDTKSKCSFSAIYNVKISIYPRYGVQYFGCDCSSTEAVINFVTSNCFLLYTFISVILCGVRETQWLLLPRSGDRVSRAAFFATYQLSSTVNCGQPAVSVRVCRFWPG